MTESEQLRILRENLRILSERAERSQTQRALCVSQILQRLLPVSEDLSPEALGDLLRDQLPELSHVDRARFFLRYVEAHVNDCDRLLQRHLYSFEEEEHRGAIGRIAFVKNKHSEQALRLLTPAVTGAKEYPVSSFADACEGVASGDCEYAILPLENNRDGKLFGFYGMLDRYELRVCAVCSLETNTPPESTRYALVGRSLPNRIPKKSNWNLECSVASPKEEFPHSLLDALGVLHGMVLRIDSLPVLYDDQLQRFYFTLQLEKKEALALHLFCAQALSRYTPIGLYPLL